MNAETFTITGSHAQLRFDPETGSITRLSGRFQKASDFGLNLLSSGGIGWTSVTGAAGFLADRQAGTYSLVSSDSSENHLSVESEWSEHGSSTPAVHIGWRVDIDEFRIAVKTTFTAITAVEVESLAVSISSNQWLLVGLFDRGILQQICAGDQVFATSDPLSVFYTVGHDQGALAVTPGTGASRSILFRNEERKTTGLRLTTVGSLDTEDEWIPSDTNSDRRYELEPGAQFAIAFDLHVNDLPFPTHRLEGSSFPSVDDAHTHFSALYSTIVGSIGSFATEGSAYPTLAQPERGYGSLHTFFDPDTWSVVNALSFSGDRYLEQQARRILERALSGITSTGQLPHHFDGEEPVYVAISGTHQSGPNLFWILAVLDYASGTGDTVWLREHWDRGIVTAINWVLNHFDEARGLLCVAGPLWIDVFKRDGYTFDTNAMAVHVLDRLADAATYLELRHLAENFRGFAGAIRRGLRVLWNGEDHYVTSRSRDWQTVEDKVDTDNYLAVAFGIADEEQATRIVERLDSGQHTHPRGRGTWVSEIFYDRDDCYGKNTGDSACAMGRLWWADLAARHAQGDWRAFRNMFEAVREDHLSMTWMTERYNADGQMVRAPGYHEYPGILDMALREFSYGLRIGLSQVSIQPLRQRPFSYELGRLALSYSPELVVVRIGGDGHRMFTVDGLVPDTNYQLNSSRAVRTNSSGAANFYAEAGVTNRLHADHA